jgi:hypothetical protein
MVVLPFPFLVAALSLACGSARSFPTTSHDPEYSSEPAVRPSILPGNLRAYVQDTLDYWRIPGAVVAFVSDEAEDGS